MTKTLCFDLAGVEDQAAFHAALMEVAKGFGASVISDVVSDTPISDKVREVLGPGTWTVTQERRPCGCREE